MLQNGPDGGAGVLLMYSGQFKTSEFTINKPAQAWRAVPGTDNKVWAGHYTDKRRPTPDDLGRDVQLQGHPVRMLDGSNWIAPIAYAWEGGDDDIIEAKGLKQITDSSAIEEIVDAVIEANPGQVAEYRGGKEKLLGFFVGKVMHDSGGKANPGQVNEILKKILSDG